MGGPIIIFEQKTYLESRPPPVLLIVFTFCVLPLVIQSVVTCQAVIIRSTVVNEFAESHQVVILHLSYILKLDNCNYLIELKS